MKKYLILFSTLFFLSTAFTQSKYKRNYASLVVKVIPPKDKTGDAFYKRKMKDQTHVSVIVNKEVVSEGSVKRRLKLRDLPPGECIIVLDHPTSKTLYIGDIELKKRTKIKRQLEGFEGVQLIKSGGLQWSDIN